MAPWRGRMILPDDVLRLLVSRLLAAPDERERSVYALRATCSTMRRVVSEAAACQPDLTVASLIALATHLEGPLRVHLLETTACRTIAQWESRMVRLAVGLAFSPARLVDTLSASQRARLVASGADGLPEVCAASLELLLHNVGSAVALLRSAEALTAGGAHGDAVVEHVAELQRARADAGDRLPHKCVAAELVRAACADLRRKIELAILKDDQTTEVGAKRDAAHAFEPSKPSKPSKRSSKMPERLRVR